MRADMPDPRSVKVPAVVYGWKCCGEAGITVERAVGKSKWLLIGRCNTCGARIEITKRGTGICKS